MKSITEFLQTSGVTVKDNTVKIVPSEKYATSVYYAPKIYEAMNDVIPNLNNTWMEYFKSKAYYVQGPFMNEYDYDKYYREYCLGNTLEYYKGKYGIYSRSWSCWEKDKKEMIEEFNEKIKNRKFDSFYFLIFSTCCDFLAEDGWDNPYNWVIEDFVSADLAIEIAMRKIIKENNLK